jgi:hypothetical protein
VTVIEVEATGEYDPSLTAVVDSVRQDYAAYAKTIKLGEK